MKYLISKDNVDDYRSIDDYNFQRISLNLLHSSGVEGPLERERGRVMWQQSKSD